MNKMRKRGAVDGVNAYKETMYAEVRIARTAMRETMVVVSMTSTMENSVEEVIVACFRNNKA